MKKVLAKKMAQRTNMSQREAIEVVTLVYEVINEALLQGYKINIRNVISLELKIAEESTMYSGLHKKVVVRPMRWNLRTKITDNFRKKMKQKPVYGEKNNS